MTKFYIGAALLAIGIAFAVWYVRRPEPLIQPVSLRYPVLLVEGDKISEVCLNLEELTVRPEYQAYGIEESVRVVDARGAKYRIENFRFTEKKPSTLSRIFNATIYSQLRLRAAFDLRPDGELSREALMGMLGDIGEAKQVGSDPASLADLYAAYRKEWDLLRAHSSVREGEPEQGAEESEEPEQSDDPESEEGKASADP